MSDRANVNVKSGDDDMGVFLYTYWGGTNLPQTLRRALMKQWRWNDDQYLARIIFDEMIGEHQGQETGFGISAYCGDGRTRVLVVNVAKQTISFKDKSWTFQEYIDLPDEDDANNIWEYGV